MNEQPDHAPVRPGSHTCVCGGWWNEHHAPAAVAADPADNHPMRSDMNALRQLVGNLIEVPGLIGDYVEAWGQSLQRLTFWLRRFDPDPDIRAWARARAVVVADPADTSR